MLILTREVGQSFLIGDDIVIKFLSSHTKHIRLGIEAPKNILILRNEVWKRNQEREPTIEEFDKILTGKIY